MPQQILTRALVEQFLALDSAVQAQVVADLGFRPPLVYLGAPEPLDFWRPFLAWVEAQDRVGDLAAAMNPSN